MKYIADLHIHSPFSRATSKKSDLGGLFAWARVKGIHLVGSGDFTHPAWFASLKESLVPHESGFFRLKDENVPQALEGISPEPIDVRFVLTAEISSIYKKNGKVRKIHNLIFVPDFESVEKINARLAAIGNIESDGRPILGLDARNLVEIVLEQAPEGFVVPAHIWTPWFSLFGSKSGFDTLEECYEDMSEHIFALETGLSSDPDMNRLVSALDRYTLISNSDCHSPSKLGREANLFDTGFDFFSMHEALKNPQDKGFVGTVEFFPEEGKYHFDGHRRCKVCLDPEETRKIDNLCPQCGRPLTIGVMHRVRELADRDKPFYREDSPLTISLIPLPEVLGEILGVGPNTKTVLAEYGHLINTFGSEFNLLMNAPIEEINSHPLPIIGEAVHRIRSGKVICKPGYDGEFGRILVFNEGELDELSGQISLFKKKVLRSKKKPKISTPFEKKNSSPEKKKKAQRKLNSEQAEAVKSTEGQVIILAGPGTGKTFTLVSRLTHVLVNEYASKEHVTAITFTNKAADEISQRLLKEAGKGADGVFVGTFHGFCLMWLRKETPELIVVGRDMREVILRSLMPEMDRSERNHLSQKITEFFHSMTLKPEEVNPQDNPLIYQYCKNLEMQQAIDLEAVIPLFIKKIHGDLEFLIKVQESVEYLFVDEFQDLNFSQYELVRILAHEARVFAIGDPDQAIYGFRGSDSAFFYQFQEECHAQIRALTRNYRSAPAIIEAATAVIKHNTKRSDIALKPENTHSTMIDFYHAPTVEAEAEFVVMKIEELMGGISHFSINSGRGGKEGTGTEEISFHDIAVVYRLSQQASALSEALERSGIPFQTVGVKPFFMESDMKAAYYWIRAASDSSAPENLSLLSQIRGIGEITVDKIEKELPLKFDNFWSSLKDMALPLKTGEKLTIIFQELENFKDKAAKNGLAPALKESMSCLSIDSETSASQRLLELAGAFGKDLSAFSHHLEYNAASTVYDDQAEAVSLMTLHGAKGLEFQAVFITGLEEGLIPCTIEGKYSDIEEERRLFYVGLTRAKESLFLTSAKTRTLFGKTREQSVSRFMAEIPSEHVRELKQVWKVSKKAANSQLKFF